MKNIPRRPFFPLLTDIREYKQAARNTIPYTKRMIDKYGDVCEASFTGIKNYFIHDPELIKEILTTQSGKFRRTFLFKAFRKFLGHGLFTSDGDYHKRQRRLIKPAFYPQRVEEYASLMVACAEEEIAGWKAGDVIDINKSMHRITMHIITRTMFSSGLDREEINEIGKDLSAVFDVTNRIIVNPFYVWCLDKEIPVRPVREFFRLKKRLDKVVNRLIAIYHREGTEGKNDLLSMLMEARVEESGEKMSDAQIRDEVMTFFMAGHETLTVALTWTCYLLGRHPETAEKFYRELRSALSGRKAEARDYESLTLTRNIFREALRLYPPAWTFAREPVEDVVIRDYHFPKGAVLWTVTYLIHRNEKYFDNPDEFNPSRWDEEKIKALPRYAYFPFGGGNRMCIGEGFAWMEGVLVLATIGAKFRLEAVDSLETDINPLFTLKTKRNVMMRLVEL